MLINFNNISIHQAQSFLNSTIAPRPIAFVSTVDKKGNINLSPFSYFNLFSVNPPIVVFSPSRRVRDNTIKHTLENIKEVPEAAISIVTYDMVQQTSLASCEYPKEVNEFIRVGFTQENSVLIQPPLVKESLVKLECKVLQIQSLGEAAGAGNLVICEVLCMHIDDGILNAEKTSIEQTKLHHVARLGGNWYCKVDSSNLFTVEKPNTKLGIGWDHLPQSILHSDVLTGNHLAQLANVEAIPAEDPSFNNMAMTFIVKQYKNNEAKRILLLHKLAAELLHNNMVLDAWQVLLRSLSTEKSEEKMNEVHTEEMRLINK